MLAEVAAAADVDPESVPTAVDGCGVVTFGLSLERMASAFSRLERPRGRRPRGARDAGVPGPPPRSVCCGHGAHARAPGVDRKGGAEGLLCAASPTGLGVALKVEDGATRAVRSASAAFLARLGVDGGPSLGTSVPLTNSLGEVVGEIVAE